MSSEQNTELAQNTGGINFFLKSPALGCGSFMKIDSFSYITPKIRLWCWCWIDEHFLILICGLVYQGIMLNFFPKYENAHSFSIDMRRPLFMKAPPLAVK